MTTRDNLLEPVHGHPQSDVYQPSGCGALPDPVSESRAHSPPCPSSTQDVAVGIWDPSMDKTGQSVHQCMAYCSPDLSEAESGRTSWQVARLIACHLLELPLISIALDRAAGAHTDGSISLASWRTRSGPEGHQALYRAAALRHEKGGQLLRVLCLWNSPNGAKAPSGRSSAPATCRATGPVVCQACQRGRGLNVHPDLKGVGATNEIQSCPARCGRLLAERGQHHGCSASCWVQQPARCQDTLSVLWPELGRGVADELSGGSQESFGSLLPRQPACPTPSRGRD